MQILGMISVNCFLISCEEICLAIFLTETKQIRPKSKFENKCPNLFWLIYYSQNFYKHCLIILVYSILFFKFVMI